MHAVVLSCILNSFCFHLVSTIFPPCFHLVTLPGYYGCAGDAATSPPPSPRALGENHFFEKIARWEAELVSMLQAQLTPLSIRAIVAVFKDRILTERDKHEFKSLCDKWTVVVEHPVGTGIKCLAIKAWMRGAQLERT